MSIRSHLISAITIVMASFMHPSIASNTPAPIQIDTGLVQGQIRQAPSGQSVMEYRGIPYAMSPTGSLRWSLPKQATPWQGVLDATHFGPACPQVSRYELTDGSLAEDCLSINVSLPADIQPGERLPVLFWIHGGAFVGGASNLYRLDKLASEGRMVVVSANYRLGFLGFVPLPGLANASVNGNFGIEDQREALRWVQRNIAKFGGDPDKVTVAGESAGAASICIHLSSPDQVKGLFHQAIIVSAGCLAPIKSVPQAIESIGKVIADNLGCTNDQNLQCLRSKSVKDILDAQTKFANEHPTELAMFAPTYGTPAHPNATIPHSVANALNRVDGGKWLPIPLMIGGMQKELLLYVGYWWQDALAERGPSLSNAAIQQTWLPKFYGAHAREVARQYGFATATSGAHLLGEVLSDFNPLLGINNCLYYQTADRIVHYPGARQTYLFEFADPDALVKGVGITPPYPDFPMGPVHSAIINYWFPHYSNNQKINAPDLPQASKALADQMIKYVGAFAATGHPNLKELPVWSVYEGSRRMMTFSSSQVGEFDGYAEHRCDWWKKLYPMQ